MVSPQDARSSTACRSCPGRTEMMLPGVGVFDMELFTVTRGSSAGPSKLLAARAVENDRARNEIATITSDAKDCMGKLLYSFWLHRVLRGSKSNCELDRHRMKERKKQQNRSGWIDAH